jgi:hypothetical protein
MKQGGEDVDATFVPDDETAEVVDPADRALDLPPPLVPTELAPILMGRDRVVAPTRNDRLDPAVDKALPSSIAIESAIGDQTIGVFPRSTRMMRPGDRDRVERRFEEPDFRRGRRVQVNSDRSTRAICQYHKLRSLAPLGLANAEPPFFAGMNVPSMKHSFQRSCCRSFSWARKARHRSSRTPLRVHWDSRRQHVVGLPYRRGSSLQGALVQRIQRMPSKHLRSSAHGRPPFGAGLCAGRCSRISSHCRSVNRRHAITNLLAPKAIDYSTTPPDGGLQGL